ncbi:hypothetical protein ACOME3_006542 [Neoechinorhynchus agilis]
MPPSSVYILDLKGKVLISRDFRGDIDLNAIDEFLELLLENEDTAQQTSPMFQKDNIAYVYIRQSNVYFVAASRSNTNISLVFAFLYRLIEVLTEYFKEVQEESIRDNFVLVYELLDEMMDFGYPQITESKILQEYITQRGNELARDVATTRPPPTVTNAVSWRSEGIRYRKNEVFLDVIESLNLLVSSSGAVLRSEIDGSIRVRTYLSGMPELKLGLNDKILFENIGRKLEDVKFHQCVRLSRFENDRTISFIPPDGEFELMYYRLNTNVKPLIWIECHTEMHARSRVEFMVKAKAQFKRRSNANSVQIVIPVPADVDSGRFKSTSGSVRYLPEKSVIVWSIKSLPGEKECLMRANFRLPSMEASEDDIAKQGSPPIRVRFEIPYFTVSGIQVRYLKIIEKSGYQALPWDYESVNSNFSGANHVPVNGLRQSIWERPLVARAHSSLLLASSDEAVRARLLAVSTRESGAWLAGDALAGVFLRQNISLAVQRGNAASVIATAEEGEKLRFCRRW